MSIAIKVENISKQYRLGEVGTGTLSHDLHRAWAKLRGKPDPFAKVADANTRTVNSPAVSRKSSVNSSDYAWALKDLSFEVREGAILGIIGRNGAGKSTLLKLLSRVTAPTSGRIKARGRIASLLEVGTGFHPELTGLENIFLNGAILGMRRAEIALKLDEIIDFSGCERYIETPVKRYSSGMYVRLAFAVAAHLESEILILDEVLAVGDAEFQKKCLEKMKDVAGQGRTVLFVSHNLDMVANLCTEITLLKAGRVERSGSPNDIVDYYSEQSIEVKHVDLDNYRIGSMGQLIAFTQIEMDNDATSIDCREDLSINLRLKSHADLKNLSIGASVYRQTGEVVGTLFNEDLFDVTKEQTRNFKLMIQSIDLAPGSYHLAFSVGTGGIVCPRNDLDLVIGTPVIHVRPRLNGKLLSPWNRSWGAIKFSDHRLEEV